MRDQKIGFVPNANYRAFMAGFKKIEGRGDKAAGMMVVLGTPGVGKTTVLDKFTIDRAAIYLRARVTHNIKALMEDLAVQMPGVSPNGSAAKVQSEIIRYLTKNKQPIVIDEIQNLMINADGKSLPKIEALRDITDLSGCELIMVAGTKGLEHEIKKYEQIFRRITEWVYFEALSVDDMQVLLDKLAHTKIMPDLTAELHAKADGRIGPVSNAIPAIDAFAEINGKESLCLADVKNIELIFDWQARRRGK